MHKSLLSFLIGLLLISSSCNMAKYHQKHGRYDTSISKSVKKLRKNPDKQKQIVTLRESFRQAQREDLDQIEFLRKSGQPENWEKILSIYTRIRTRQNKVKSLPELYDERNSKIVVFDMINTDDEIVSTKQKTAEYLYAIAENLLKKGDRFSARQAYDELSKVKKYYANFKDTDALMEQASTLGSSNVLFRMENKTKILMPADFEKDLKRISMQDLNRRWLKYYTTSVQGMKYDFDVVVNLKFIDVTPERIRENRYTETKQIQDGWNYQLDPRGNVMKDSLGNDIKTPKFRTISCDVIETVQSKSARIAGDLEYVNLGTSQLIKADPLTSDAVFEYYSAIAIGDQNALKPETKANLGRTPIPFPNDFDLLMQAGNTLKGMVKDILYKNKELLN